MAFTGWLACLLRSPPTVCGIGTRARSDALSNHNGRLSWSHPHRVGRTTVNDLRNDIKEFIEERNWEQFHSPKNLAMALSVEVSEIVEHFQWLTEEQSSNLSPEKLTEVREEIGDVMIYLTEFAEKLGIDPVEAAKAKLEINRQKYPADLVKGKAYKYTEYE